MILLALMPLMTFIMAVDNTIDGENIIQKDYELYYQKGDEKTPYTGSVVYFNEGKKWQEGSFKDGRKQGTWKLYYNNGKVADEGSYVHGRKEGVWQHYSHDGKKLLSTCYRDFINGPKVWERGIRPDGVNFEGLFIDGVPDDGVVKELYPWGFSNYIDTRGNVDAEKYVSYKKGLKDGITIWFGPDKKILAEGYYSNDERWKGKFIIPRSKFLWEIITYNEGVPDGEVRYFAIDDVTWRGGDYFKYKMIELKPCGVYKEGQRWEGLFIKPYPTKEDIWERMFYEGGKLIKKEYTKAYSGNTDTVKDDELPDNKTSSKAN